MIFFGNSVKEEFRFYWFGFYRCIEFLGFSVFRGCSKGGSVYRMEERVC